MQLKSFRYLLIPVALVCGASASVLPGPGGVVWQDRVVPLPQEMAVAEAIQLSAGEIRFEIDCAEPEAAPLTTALDLLGAFAQGDETASGLVVSLLDRAAAAGRVPEALLDRLAALPNGDQAYIIVSEAGESPRLTLVGNSPIGLLYAARTLNQLVLPPAVAAEPALPLTLPLVDIVDWPDIRQRGAWGHTNYDLHWFARWKLNRTTIVSYSTAEPDGTLSSFGIGHSSIDWDLLQSWAVSVGIGVHPGIVHLGHISGRMWGGNWQGISVPKDHPDQPTPRGSYGPGFCWSDATIQKVMVAHMRQIAESLIDPRWGIRVSLSEGGDVSCWCPDCGGENGYLSETRGTLRAFDVVRREFPDLRLGISLSQGSADVNEQIVTMLPPDVDVHFYHGHVTYRINREAIIPPYLEEFARAGGSLGVTWIQNHWGVAVPSTQPQYIRFRMREFADKKLEISTNFWVPDRYHYEFNVAANGEWAWNANGRSPADFARAFAVVTGMDDPGAFSAWAIEAGEAAWELAEIDPFNQFHQGRIGRAFSLPDPDRFAQSLDAACRARYLATATGSERAMLESEITLAGLRSVRLLEKINQAMTDGDSAETLTALLLELDAWGHWVRANIEHWDQIVVEQKQQERLEPFPAGEYQSWFLRTEGLHSALEPTANVLLHAADALWDMAALSGVSDARTDTLPIEVGEWTSEDVAGDLRLQSIDLTEHLPTAGGRFDFGLIFFEGDPLRVHAFNLYQVDPETGTRQRLLPAPYLATGGITLSPRARADKFNFVFDVPPVPDGARIVLEFNTRHGGQGSDGIMLLRPTWRRSQFPPETLERLHVAAELNS